MIKIKTILLSALILAFGIFSSCDDNGDFLLFSVQDDIDLGQQVAAEIASDPETYPILSETQYPEAYAYLEGMMDEILSSSSVTYRNEFPWKINIIDQDVLNAFATPGGQIYVYTGLIYFLDTEDDLAGVIGHEIAHADQRHSSKQLQKSQGISVLLAILTGENSGALTEVVTQVAGGLAALKFSRDDEAEADDFSVEYLADTDYACNGAASFFEKLLDNEEGFNPEFLSTHPSPDNRVADINAKADEEGCDTTVDDGADDRYVAFQAFLP